MVTFLNAIVDHLVVGRIDKETTDIYVFNQEEVKDVKWVNKEELEKWMAATPNQFTPWFRLIHGAYLKDGWSCIKWPKQLVDLTK